MTSSEPNTDQLLHLAEQGDQHARNRLLDRHRDRLCHLVALRLDPRLKARLDPSDIVQESLVEADRRLEEYWHDRPMSFYAWLRQLTLDRMIELYRQHVTADKRSVRREVSWLALLPEESLHDIMAQLVSRGSSPSAGLHRADQRRQVRKLLASLSETERDILIMRHLEHLSIQEIAATLGISTNAAKVRHVRALARLRGLIVEDERE